MSVAAAKAAPLALSIDLTTPTTPRVAFYHQRTSQIEEIQIPSITQREPLIPRDRNVLIKGMSRTRTLPGRKVKKVAILERNHQLHPLPPTHGEQQRTVKRYFSPAIHELDSNENTDANEPILNFLHDCLQILSHIKKCVSQKSPQTKISHVLVAIPTAYTIIQRQAVSSAVKVMGWKLIRLVNNTTALCLYHWFDIKEKDEKNNKVNGLKSSLKLACCLAKDSLELSIVGLRESKITIFATYSSSIGHIEDDLMLRSIICTELKRCEEYLIKKQLILTEVLLTNELPEYEDTIIDELTDIFPETKISNQQASAIVEGTTILSRYLTLHLLPQSSSAPSLPPLKLKETTSHKIQIYSSSHRLPLSLPRNSFIPFITQTMHSTNIDNKSYIRVYIYEGDVLKETNLLGIVTIEGLKKLPAGLVNFEVRIIIRTDGVVKVDQVIDSSTEGNKSDTFTWDFEERGRLCDDDLKELQKTFGLETDSENTEESNSPEKCRSQESDEGQMQHKSEEKPSVDRGISDSPKLKPHPLSIVTHQEDTIKPQTLDINTTTTPTDSITPQPLPDSAPSLSQPSSLASTPVSPTIQTLTSTSTFRNNFSAVARTPPTIRKTVTDGVSRSPTLASPRTPIIGSSIPPMSPLGQIDTPDLLRIELLKLLNSVKRLSNNKRFQSHIGAAEVSTIVIICDHLKEQIEALGSTKDAEIDEDQKMKLLTSWRLDFEDLITPVLKRFDDVLIGSPSFKISNSEEKDEGSFSFELPLDPKHLEETKKRLSWIPGNLTSARRTNITRDNLRRSLIVSTAGVDDIIEKFNKLVY